MDRLSCRNKLLYLSFICTSIARKEEIAATASRKPATMVYVRFAMIISLQKKNATRYDFLYSQLENEEIYDEQVGLWHCWSLIGKLQ